MFAFAWLPLWLPVRTAMAALDGTLAIEFGQNSRLGGILNEVGDVVSDIALFLPLAFVAPFSFNAVSSRIALIVCAEIAGVVGPLLGSDRRLDGPFGRADRSIVLAIIGPAMRHSAPCRKARKCCCHFSMAVSFSQSGTGSATRSRTKARSPC
jgi:CDP-diacylglycerol--glycerol-3-phosphate 3-phosphatidyltransferase